MYISLGNFTFDKQFSPDGLSHSDESSFAEHALINLKPRLQPTGNNLEEITFSIRLRAEFINITDTLLALKLSKDTAEVLPFLYGYGSYLGDYVITKIDRNIVYTLDDGTPVEVSLSIALKEYVVPDKLQQQQNAARKNAFSVGDKQPSVLPAVPKYLPSQITAQDLSTTYSHAAITDANIRKYQNSTTQQQSLASKIKTSLTAMGNNLNDAVQQLTNNPVLDDASDLLAQIADVKSNISNFTFPITSTAVLINNNTNLQGALRVLKTSSYPLTNIIITRRG